MPYGEQGPHWSGTVEFEKGCFEESLKEIEAKEAKAYIAADAHMLDPLNLLANSLSEAVRGTVKYEDKDDGLYATVVLPNTSAGRDVAELVENDVIDSCSIGVFIHEYKSAEDPEDESIENMTITKATNRETSLVARPRFEGATVEKSDNEENGADDKPAKNSTDVKLDRMLALLEELSATRTVEEPEPGLQGGTELPLHLRLVRQHPNIGANHDNHGNNQS